MNKYVITDSDLTIIDSYQVKKRDFTKTLDEIQEKEPKSSVWKRGKPQMNLEWATHNACYFCHIMRSRTKDVDLEYPQPFLERAAYAIVGCLVWIFIP